MRRIGQAQLLAADELADSPVARACDDHSFELPTGLYVAMGIMFAGSIAVVGMAFREHMGISFGVIFAFLAAVFAVPSLFPRMARDSSTRALQWNEFQDRGIDTATGRTKAGPATILILALPLMPPERVRANLGTGTYEARK